MSKPYIDDLRDTDETFENVRTEYEEVFNESEEEMSNESLEHLLQRIEQILETQKTAPDFHMNNCNINIHVG